MVVIGCQFCDNEGKTVKQGATVRGTCSTVYVYCTLRPILVFVILQRGWDKNLGALLKEGSYCGHKMGLLLRSLAMYILERGIGRIGHKKMGLLLRSLAMTNVVDARILP
jgi:hypothetical protein